MNIGIYFAKNLDEKSPFHIFKKKIASYQSFVLFLKKRNHRVFLISKQSSYAGGLRFSNTLEFEKNKFFWNQGEVIMDCIYDRSISLEFPSDMISNKVINCLEFKKLCADKHLMGEFFGAWMPRTYCVGGGDIILEKIKKLDKNIKLVYKPKNGMCGRGIIIGYPKDIVLNIKEEEYILQEFIDTAAGIVGVVTGEHDLRIVFVGKTPCFANIRQPKAGSLISNVAKGGSIKEVLISELPRNIIRLATKIAEKINKTYGENVFSLDFGVVNGKPYLFEINDIIGFPGDDFTQKEKFYLEVCCLAEKL